MSDAYRLRVRSGLRGCAPPAWVNSSLKPGQLIDLNQQRRQLHPGQLRRRGLGERIRLGRKLFGGQRRHDQLTVITETRESLGAWIRQDRLQRRDCRVQLMLDSIELPGHAGVSAGDGAEVVSLPGPPILRQQQGGRIGVAA